MYRQIWVTESQHDYQRILWRENPDQPLNTYRLKTVTYGVITASYLATACLNRVATRPVFHGTVRFLFDLSRVPA